MSIQADITSQIFVIETLDLPGSGRPVVRHDAFKLTQSYSDTTTPVGSKVVSGIIALTAGAATLNLAALAGTQGTIDGTGLKVRSFWIKNLREDGTANANSVTIGPGASNGYNVFGSASGLVTLGPGDVAHWTPQAAQTIASGDRNIDFAGTGTDSFQFVLILG